jgi:hypothetical protein
MAELKRQRVLEEYNAYMQAVYHGVPVTGVPFRGRAWTDELKMAFYGGAAAALKVLMRDLAPGDEPTDSDLESLRAMQQELTAYAKVMKPPAM